MGEVYLARHPRLPKHVALKLLAARSPLTPTSVNDSCSKLTSLRRCITHTLSVSTITANMTTGSGSPWTTSTGSPHSSCSAATPPQPRTSAIKDRLS